MDATQPQQPVLAVCYLCGKLQLSNTDDAGSEENVWVEPGTVEAHRLVDPLLKNLADNLRFSYTCCPDCLDHFQRVTAQQHWRNAVHADASSFRQAASLKS